MADNREELDEALGHIDELRGMTQVLEAAVERLGGSVTALCKALGHVEREPSDICRGSMVCPRCGDVETIGYTMDIWGDKEEEPPPICPGCNDTGVLDNDAPCECSLPEPEPGR